MSVQRITQNINLESRENFILFYGNVNDQFCSNDLIYGNIDQMLWKYFNLQGYQKIIFSNELKSLYFLDEKSLSLCLLEQENNQTYELIEGPLGNVMLLDKIAVTLDNKTNQQNNFFNIDLSDKDAKKEENIALLQLLNSAILEQIPTIFIIKNIENITEKNYTKETVNSFCQMLKEFSSISSNLNNKCVIIFNKSQLDKIIEVIEKNKLSFLNEYISFKKNSDYENLIKINFPTSDEINNLIHHFRILDKLQIDWSLVDNISNFLENQEMPLKFLYRKLKTIKQNEILDKTLLLKWHKEGFWEKSTEFIINNLDKQFCIRELLLDYFKTIYYRKDIINTLLDKLELWFSIKKKKNILSLLFLGNSGSGKKYTIKCMVEALKSLGYEFYSFAMSEYKEYEDIIDVFKSNFEKNEVSLFEKLQKKNKLIILFDEIDISHQNILKSITNILNRGFLISNSELKFDDCIFCFTINSNLENIFSKEENFFENKLDRIESQNLIKSILIKNEIIPELCKKIDLFLLYDKLNAFALVEILEQKVKNIALEYNIEIISIDPVFLADIMKKTDTLGTKGLYNYLLEEIGNLLIKYNKDFPKSDKTILQKNKKGIKFIPFNEFYNILSRESVFKTAVDIYNKNTLI